MKYVIVQGDGMADFPLEELSGKTPLEAAEIPNMDRIAAEGTVGTVNTIPAGLPAGSSVGNMSLMGLDPRKHFSGRAPLEARGLGVEVGEKDIALRCNLVELDEERGRRIMKDYSGGHPDQEEASGYLELLDEKLGGKEFRFYPGVSYRNLLVWKGGRKAVDPGELDVTPPHDITGEPIARHLPGSRYLRELQSEATSFFGRNGDRINGVWFWGAGVRPEIPTFKERYGLGGTVISAVDLIKGLGAYAGLEPVEVSGATGFIDTNYQGKVKAVKENLEDRSLAYLHIEAPDEASHMGDSDLKLEAIERIDQRVIVPLFKWLESEGDASLLLVTDHVTSIESGTHERGAVPFSIRDFPGGSDGGVGEFSEAAAASGTEFEDGAGLLDYFLKRR